MSLYIYSLHQLDNHNNKEKILTAKYTEFYTLTALHNVCHTFFLCFSSSSSFSCTRREYIYVDGLYFFFCVVFSFVIACQLRHHAHLLSYTIHLVDFVCIAHCLAIPFISNCNRVKKVFFIFFFTAHFVFLRLVFCVLFFSSYFIFFIFFIISRWKLTK